MPAAAELIREVRAALERAGLYNQNEINVLFECGLGKRPGVLQPDEVIDQAAADQLRQVLARRLGGEPLQYIAGRWPFLDFELEVGPGVLIPRPETEQLAQQGVLRLRGKDAPRVLDLCSGSGCVAIAIKRALPEAEVSALELSQQALEYLRHNAKALCGGLEVIQADVLQAQSLFAQDYFDLITANPPYVTRSDYQENLRELEREPEMAFVGGEDGLMFYRHIIPAYLPLLRRGGCMALETGFDQTETVAEMMKAAGYTCVEVVCDLFGLPRNVIGCRPDDGV